MATACPDCGALLSFPPLLPVDPDPWILRGRCVEACQNVEVNETLSIDKGLKGFADGLEKPVSNPICDFCGKFGRSS